MTLTIRKLIVLALVLGVVLLANLMLIAGWLQDAGVIDAAQDVRRKFLTGTAITILVALLVLLVPGGAGGGAGRRCSVCERRVPNGRSCPECGSRR